MNYVTKKESKKWIKKAEHVTLTIKIYDHVIPELMLDEEHFKINFSISLDT